ncbi:MAG: FG-GAP-like repeat-containing protein [Pirellulaceae bacterium]
MIVKPSFAPTIFAVRSWVLFAALVGYSMIGSFSTGSVFAQDPELLAEIQKAQTLLAQQDFESAEKMLRTLSEKYPDKPGPKYLLGNAVLAQKRYDEALAIFEKAKEFPQVKANSLYNIACIMAISSKPDEAIASLEEAIKAGFTNFGQLQTDSDLASLKDDPRFQRLIPKLLSDEELFVEPVRIIHKWTGEAAGDQFGWTARRVGDLDGDSITDFITTAPTHDRGAGKVYVYSSKTGKLIHSVKGQPGDGLGNSAVGIGDLNGDGVADFAAGAPTAKGMGVVRIYSGSDASVIHKLAGNTTGARFGHEVSECGDIDHDGTPDILVGEMVGNGAVDQCGRVIVFSGKSYEVLFELSGEQTGDCFGNAAAVEQIGDQEFLLAVGAQEAGPSKRGRVYVYHVLKAKPSLRFMIEGDTNSVNLGQMFLSFPGDVDRDGTPDVYASDFGDNTKVAGGGKVVVHSGKDGRELAAIFGTVSGEGLGTSPSDAGDVDGDGIGDLIIGAWQNREGAVSGGKAYLYSLGKNAKLLRTITCKQAGDTLGFDACGIGDIDGDGKVDFLITAAWSNNPSSYHTSFF